MAIGPDVLEIERLIYKLIDPERRQHLLRPIRQLKDAALTGTKQELLDKSHKLEVALNEVEVDDSEYPVLHHTVRDTGQRLQQPQMDGVT